MDPEKFNRSPVRRRRGGKKLQRGKEANHKRLLNTENKLRVDGGGRGKWVMGIEEGTFWDEHWVLYGNQFDNKFYIKKIKCVCLFYILHMKAKAHSRIIQGSVLY